MHNWDDFRFFGAVAETGSYSKAATSLGVNHSTVSRRVQAMEVAHGVKLFERTQYGYQLTEAGASIFEIVQQLQDKTHQAARILLGQDARLEGTINLTMPNDMFMFLMAEPLKLFSDQHPGITFNLLVSKGLRNMANREADLAVRVTATPPDYLIGTKITHIQHGLYQREDLAQHDYTPVIIWGSESNLPTWTTQYFKNPKVIMRVDDLYAMHQAVRAGFGIARMPCFIPDIVQDEKVVRLPVDVPLSDFAVWILHHQDLRTSAKINQCRGYIKEVLTAQKGVFSGEYSRFQ
ncbi:MULTISPECIES: LysR family transcriptional regulator [Thalassotalea]|uniref:LysR family transcriptional regulator n=1 Tax=Thalassotalea TaxID=1518149 RepID=UPI0009420F3B|nr:MULTISPECIES: LysR family transcriptional regulator [Thalassotalea]OKY27924.1 LysR family transcriptional regulator [Thalassotalea sp. PP2-459]